MSTIVEDLKQNYKREKAKIDGVGLSHARMIKQAAHIPGVVDQLDKAPRAGGPVPIDGANIRMLDGKVMNVHTDGSMRHLTGRKPGKAARKAMKRLRRQQQESKR